MLKFLLDANGQPLRRYPRKFPISLIEADVDAVLNGRPLPEPSARLVQAWEAAKREAIKSEYAFKPVRTALPPTSRHPPRACHHAPLARTCCRWVLILRRHISQGLNYYKKGSPAS